MGMTLFWGRYMCLSIENLVWVMKMWQYGCIYGKMSEKMVGHAKINYEALIWLGYLLL